jgi:ligand-binding sensor domain-containing protein/DNA-binding CsgD family transcriptional regulator
MRISIGFFLSILLCTQRVFGIQDNPAFLLLPKGLTSNSVSTIVQDKDGFMWIGTLTGLNMYDGYRYKTYDFNLLEKNTITNSRITDLKLANDGKLWIATYGGGLNIYDPRYRRFENISLGSGAKDLLANNVLEIFISKAGNVYAGTEAGLFLVVDDSLKIFKQLTYGKLGNTIVNCLNSDSEGNVWIGTQGEGLFKTYFDTKNSFVAESVPLKGQSVNIRAMSTDNKGNIWIGYFENGFSQLLMEKGNIKKFVHSSSIAKLKPIDYLPVQTIFCSENGEIWLGTENAGLAVINQDSYDYKLFEHNDNEPNSLPDNSIWSIYRDNSGIMWLGTYSHGVCRIDPFWNKFDQFSEEISFLNNQLFRTIVNSFCAIDDKNIFVATDGEGLFKYSLSDKNQLSSIKTSSKNILSVAPINNEIYVCSWNGGIDVFTKQMKFIKHLLGRQPIFKIICDNQGFFWAVSWGNGIFLMDQDGKLIRNFTATDGTYPILSSNIFTISDDSENRIWVGTLNGLNVITHKNGNDFTIKNYTSLPGDSTTLSSNIILSLYQDLEENIWIGASNGLNKFLPESGKFERVVNFQTANSYEIRSILESNNHNLWLGTNKGLIRYNIYSKKARIYSESDGLPFLEFRGNSGFEVSADKFVFGGNGGVIIFDPKRIEDNPKAPNTIITDLKIFNKSVEIGEKSVLQKSISELSSIVLSHKMNVFTLEFTSINYTRPEKNTYEYILEGLETNWNNVGNQRNATYSNLEAGTYTFKVRSANNDGIWDETPQQLKIIVTPPFYKTLWFRIILIIFIGLIVYLGVSLRLNELRRSVTFSENMARMEKWKRLQIEFEQQKEKLGSELDERTQELAEVNLQVAHKNEKLFAVHQQILDILPNASRENYKKLVQLRRSLEEDINQKENWKALETGINLSHDNFLHRFTEKYPKITHKDLKLVAYIRMNLSNKEIANLLNITLRSVESGRYRLRKRLDILKDTNLNDFIMRL